MNIRRLTIGVIVSTLMFTAISASPAFAVGRTTAQVQTVSQSVALPTIGVRNCTSSWWNPAFCTDFNRTDQQALHAGSAAAIGAFLCYVGVPCPLVAVTFAIGEVYLNGHGDCSHYLWVRAFSFGP